jgi:hypothetical protein
MSPATANCRAERESCPHRIMLAAQELIDRGIPEGTPFSTLAQRLRVCIRASLPSPLDHCYGMRLTQRANDEVGGTKHALLPS